MPKELSGKKLHASPFQIIMLGFFWVILLGAFLLSLPVSSKAGVWTPFYDSLFTATSATCVTGLVVKDTATYWSVFGKVILFILIQTGGLGVVTVGATFMLMTKKRFSLSHQALMQEAISANQLGGITQQLRFIVFGVLIFESCGAILLYPVFLKEFGAVKGIFYAIFHSVSAFCNAGFDLMGVRAPFSSLTTLQSSVLLNVTVVLLILTGGIGFATWDDIRKHKFHFKRYSLQSKLVLTTTFFLVLIPFLLLFFFEYPALSGKERVLASLFQAVTPRTAGFNTMDYGAMNEDGIVMTIFLMICGGASGSTAGGMKINTLAVLLASSYAVTRRKKDVSAFGRRIDQETVLKAGALLLIYLGLSLGSALVLCYIEKLPYLTCLFETTSAVATVGLTMGITAGLSHVSGIILIFLMFFGRLGGLTMFYAAFSDNKGKSGRYPVEHVNVG